MKIAVIGLDGLSENMIAPYRDQLPIIDRLLSEGASGTLQSTLPPVTLPAWTTFSTGKNPGRHGMYNMTEITPDYDSPPVTPNDSEGALYDAIDDSVFINLQGAYGRDPRGSATLIPGGSPSVDAALPDEIQEWEEADNYSVKRDADLDPNNFIDDLIDISKARFALSQRAKDEYDPELLFVLFSSPDWLFHYLGSRGDESMILPLMKYLDGSLEWYLEEADNVLIMSDHGFERKQTAAYPNKILEDNGLLSTTAPEDTSTSARLTVQLIQQLTKRSDIMHEFVRKVYNRFIHTEIAENLYQAKQEDIEFNETVAWHDGWGVIYLNDSYFEQGTVDETEYDDLQQKVIDTLSGSKHPKTDEQLFQDVLPGEKVYEGIKGVVPDVVINPSPGVMLYQSPMQDKIASKTNIYNHRRAGIYAATGEDINTVSRDAEIQDIAPTIMHLMNRQVPDDMDGSVITDIISTNRNIEYCSPIEPGRMVSRTSEDKKEIREQLADLGYLE
jgi:predicted AlkP superfamily phosphohydrolase/phosphomutase